jgi:hypothetical protein
MLAEELGHAQIGQRLGVARGKTTFQKPSGVAVRPG